MKFPTVDTQDTRCREYLGEGAICELEDGHVGQHTNGIVVGYLSPQETPRDRFFALLNMEQRTGEEPV